MVDKAMYLLFSFIGSIVFAGATIYGLAWFFFGVLNLGQGCGFPDGVSSGLGCWPYGIYILLMPIIFIGFTMILYKQLMKSQKKTSKK